MNPGLEPATLPADAVEVGRILDAWGIQGGFRVQPYSASPEALFSCRQWFLQPPERGAKVAFEGTVRLSVRHARAHGEGLVASAREVPDRTAAEGLRGARIFIARSAFPPLPEGEYYWVDLIGLAVVNREGVSLGQVSDLMATGPQQVLVVHETPAGADKPVERLIPFVAAYVDTVDVAARQIVVDWQPDY